MAWHWFFCVHVVFGSRQEQARRWRSFYQPWSTLTASLCMSSTDLFLTKETLKLFYFVYYFCCCFLFVCFFLPPPPTPDMNILKHVWKFEFCQVCWACTMGNNAIENCCVSIIFLFSNDYENGDNKRQALSTALLLKCWKYSQGTEFSEKKRKKLDRFPTKGQSVC